MRSLDESRTWWERARQVIPMGTQTLSKGPTQFVQGISPIFLQRGRGAYVWDVDGNRYLDFPMALGPILLGYADARVTRAVVRQLEDGITFTMMHPLEVEIAERIRGFCPGVEAVRFMKSGSDATSAAIRVARAVTSRDRVLTSGYHGWHDWYVGSTSRSLGVPQGVADLTTAFDARDHDGLEKLLKDGEVAAVILEPSGSETYSTEHLQKIVDLTRAHGAVAIFDEIITGFRLAPGGARERYGVEPDLSCYGKALGNGMPISAVAGRWEIMRVFENIFVSGTHGGETTSLAAAGAVLDAIENEGVLQHIHSLGRLLQDRLKELVIRAGLDERIRISGEPERTVVGALGTDPWVVKSWIQQCLMERGILFNGSMFICGSHTRSHVDEALEAFAFAFNGLEDEAEMRSRLVGDVIEPVFRPPA